MKKQELERWRAIPGLKCRYQASSKGRIRRMPHFQKFKTRHNTIGKRFLPRRIVGQIFCKSNGYYMVKLGAPPRNTHTVHKCIALAFIYKPKNIYTEVNHKDGKKINNNVSNLEWVTRSQNRQHAFDNGLQEKTKKVCREIHRGENSHKTKLKNKDVIEMRNLYKKIKSQRKISKLYNMSKSAVSSILNRMTWKHV